MPQREPITIRVSSRQEEVLTLAAEGFSDKEIANRLGVSIGTVRTHLERFYKSNRVRNRTEAVALFVRYKDAR